MQYGDEELDDVERRAAAATEGPWKSIVEGRDQDSGDSFVLTSGPDLYVSCSPPQSEEQRIANLDFIAAARQDVPRLVEEVRRLRALLDAED